MNQFVGNGDVVYNEDANYLLSEEVPTMSNQDGLDPKDFNDLIARLSRRKQESPSAQIPFQDVKDILQDEGLLESLLKEHVSSIEKKCYSEIIFTQ